MPSSLAWATNPGWHASAFAMHASEQVERARNTFGRGRYTLGTGDLGTALYLADCLAGTGAPPLP